MVEQALRQDEFDTFDHPVLDIRLNQGNAEVPFPSLSRWSKVFARHHAPAQARAAARTYALVLRRNRTARPSAPGRPRLVVELDTGSREAGRRVAARLGSAQNSAEWR
jgi:hypothetical protein